MIEEFLIKNPDIILDLHLSDEVINIVNQGYDLAIRVSDLPDSSLKCLKLRSSERIVCASKSYLKKFGSPKKLQDLKKHNCLILNNERIWKFRKNKKKEHIIVKGNLKTNLGDTIINYLNRGLGIAFMAKWHMEKGLENKSIVQLFPEYQFETNPSVYIVYPNTKKVPAKTRALVDFLKDNF